MMKQDMLLCTKKLHSWRGLVAQDLRVLLALLREADVSNNNSVHAAVAP